MNDDFQAVIKLSHNSNTLILDTFLNFDMLS